MPRLRGPTRNNIRAHQNRANAFLFQQGHHELDHIVSFENGVSNLPKESPYIEIKDSQDLGQIGADQVIPVVTDPNAPIDPTKKVEETDRLGRFLQLRPSPDVSFPIIQPPAPKVAVTPAPTPGSAVAPASKP